MWSACDLAEDWYESIRHRQRLQRSRWQQIRGVRLRGEHGTVIAIAFVAQRGEYNAEVMDIYQVFCDLLADDSRSGFRSDTTSQPVGGEPHRRIVCSGNAEASIHDVLYAIGDRSETWSSPLPT